MFCSRFRPSSRLRRRVHLVSLCFTVTFISPHVKCAIHSFLSCGSRPPHLWCAVRPSLTLKPSTVALVLEVPGLATLRAPQVACDLTPVCVCVCVCVYSPHSMWQVSSVP